MKYIRTKDTLASVEREEDIELFKKVGQKVADTIEELCDCYSYDTETTRDFAVARSWKLHNLEREIYGCIKTGKGLIYVAQMNDKGELELL